MTRSRRGTRRSRTERGSRRRRVTLVDGRCITSGKRPFDTEDAALAAAFEFSQNNSFVASSHSAYECADCGHFHLTSG